MNMSYKSIVVTRRGGPEVLQIVENELREPASLPIEIRSEATKIVSYGFSLPGGDQLIALWTDGVAVENDPGVEATVILQKAPAQTVMATDVLSGLEQEMLTDQENGDLVIRGLLVKDCPIVLRLTGLPSP